MEMTIAPSISLLKSGFHGVGCFEETFFPDLEENFSPCRVEGSVRGLGMVGSVLPILLLTGPVALNAATCSIGSELLSTPPALEAESATGSAYLVPLHQNVVGCCVVADEPTRHGLACMHRIDLAGFGGSGKLDEAIIAATRVTGVSRVDPKGA
ncbi:hypothetical protein GW17_00049621 [Ensete ventricosum]|nr:hypothetical protein GW17_00049621 [Ensete ventricosum]